MRSHYPVGVNVGVKKMAKLTALQLKALKLSDIGMTLRDEGGLWGRVRKAGEGVSVTFWYRYRWGGKTRDTACGTWPGLTLAEIRTNRDNARKFVADDIDPNEQRKVDRREREAAETARKAEQAAQASRLTFRKMFDAWEKLALSNRKDKGAETRRAFELDIFPALGERWADEIQRGDVLAALDEITGRGARRLANRTLADLKQLFKWAMVRGYVAVAPLIGVAKKDVGGSEVERNRILSADELRALPAALSSCGLRERTQHILWTVLATNVRIGEAMRARRADIDLDAGTWKIPRENSKNTDPHIVFLSDFARSHLRMLLDASVGSEWLMPTSRGDTHADPKSVTKQVADRQLQFYARKAHSKRTKYENALVLVPHADGSWTPHDLRRTAATLMQSLRVAPDVIEACMNHRPENRMIRIYQRHDRSDEKREAWRLLGDRLDLLTRDHAGNVLLFAPAVNA